MDVGPLEHALRAWAEERGCAEINLLETSEFTRLWIVSGLLGLSFFLAVVFLTFWFEGRPREKHGHESEVGYLLNSVCRTRGCRCFRTRAQHPEYLPGLRVPFRSRSFR